MREANRAARELLGLNEEALDGASLAAFVKETERPFAAASSRFPPRP